MKYTIKPCTRKNLCVDCDDAECQLAGVARADCPKQSCDNPIGDCNTCVFMKQYRQSWGRNIRRK